MKAPRVVLDTNVLVSALCFGGPPAKVLRLVLTGKVRLSTSPVLIDELAGVMRLKFPEREAEIMDTLSELSSLWDVVTSEQPPLSVVQDDPDDNRVLECALAAKAECIVSGDKHLLKLGRFRDIDIVPPALFLRRVEL